MHKINSILLPIIEIIMMIFIIIISCILVNNYNNNFNKEIIENNNLAINLNDNTDKLYVLSDEEASKKLKSATINISNYNNNVIKYRLIMKVKKNNNLNYEMIKMKLNDQIFNLATKYSYEDNNYLYFELIRSNIDKENKIEYAIWLNEEIVNYYDYKLNYKFYVETV